MLPAGIARLGTTDSLTRTWALAKAVLANRVYHMRYHLPKLIQKGTTVHVRFWYRKEGGKKLHPRFVLTEHGALYYDYGLDEGDCPGDTTIVGLVDHELWETVRTDYGGVPSREPAFAKDADCVVEIRGEG